MLVRHKNSEQHKRSFVISRSAINIFQYFNEKTSSKDYQVAKSGLLFAGFFAEYHIPFIHVDHLLTLSKLAFPHSQTASKLSMKQTKLLYVMQDGIAFHEELEVSRICKEIFNYY